VVSITITAADTFCSSAAFRTQDSSASDWAADHCGLTDLTAMADEDAGDGAGLAGGDVEREEVDKFRRSSVMAFNSSFKIWINANRQEATIGPMKMPHRPMT